MESKTIQIMLLLVVQAGALGIQKSVPAVLIARNAFNSLRQNEKRLVLLVPGQSLLGKMQLWEDADLIVGLNPHFSRDMYLLQLDPSELLIDPEAETPELLAQYELPMREKTTAMLNTHTWTTKPIEGGSAIALIEVTTEVNADGSTTAVTTTTNTDGTSTPLPPVITSAAAREMTGRDKTWLEKATLLQKVIDKGGTLPELDLANRGKFRVATNYIAKDRTTSTYSESAFKALAVAAGKSPNVGSAVCKAYEKPENEPMFIKIPDYSMGPGGQEFRALFPNSGEFYAKNSEALDAIGFAKDTGKAMVLAAVLDTVAFYKHFQGGGKVTPETLVHVYGWKSGADGSYFYQEVGSRGTDPSIIETKEKFIELLGLESKGPLHRGAIFERLKFY